MRVRQIDGDHDWTFGKGQNNYVRDGAAVGQNIDTRLSSFLGDCFFDTGAGLDWFNLLGAKVTLPLNLAVSATILNTEGVTGIRLLSSQLDTARRYTVTYEVQTTFTRFSASFVFDANALVIG